MWKINLIFVLLMGLSSSISGNPQKTILECQINNRDCFFFSQNVRPGESVIIEVDWNDSHFNRNTSWVVRAKFFDSEVQEIPNELLQKFPRLVDISLEGQGVKRIFQETFRGGGYIRQIYLPHNFIETLDEDLFLEAAGVTFIYLSFNHINKIDRNTFRHLYNLEYLNLRANRIGSLHEFVFSDLRKLRTLFLHGNNLSYLPRNLLANNKQLEIVFFNDNRISSLDPRMFSHISGLRTLTMLRNVCVNEQWIEVAHKSFDWIEWGLRRCATSNMGLLH